MILFIFSPIIIDPKLVGLKDIVWVSVHNFYKFSLFYGEYMTAPHEIHSGIKHKQDNK